MRRLLLLVVVLLAGGALAACSEDSAGPDAGVDVEDVEDEQRDFDDDVGADEEVGDDEFTAGDVDGDDELVGQTVTVSAEVGNVILGSKAFTIGEEQVDNGVLVLVPKGMTVPQDLIREGAAVQVVGEVVEFRVADIEAMDEFGADFFADDEEDLFIDFEERNAIVAQAIRPAPPEDEAENDL